MEEKYYEDKNNAASRISYIAENMTPDIKNAASKYAKAKTPQLIRIIIAEKHPFYHKVYMAMPSDWRFCMIVGVFFYYDVQLVVILQKCFLL